MRLSFRKAGRGRIRGKSVSVKNPSTAASAASRSGWTDPWPPPCPDEVMSGRGGGGAGGSRCGTAPAGALCCARARGGRGLRVSLVTSVREVTTTSAVLWALLTTVERDTTPTTACARFGRPKALPASRSCTRPALGGAAGGPPGFADVDAIGGDAAVESGWVAAATSVSTLTGAAGIFTVVEPATFRVTLWSPRVGACGTTASTSARAASTSADTSMPAGPAARAVPGPASPLQAIAPAKAHTRASQGRPRPAASAAS
jgi:hypothetical protein